VTRLTSDIGRNPHSSPLRDYSATWLTVLKNDNRAIFQAAAHAQRAIDYLHKLQPERMEAAA
jgi:antirestriction protein ArdC